MSLFDEPQFSSHVPSVHTSSAGMGEVATQEDWPVWSRSSVLNGAPTGQTAPFLPTGVLATASVPTADINTSFFPSSGLSNIGDSSDTANAAAAAPPTLNQAGGDIFSNKLFVGVALIAGTFLALSLLKGKR